MSNRLNDLLWQHETGIEVDKDELIRELVIERQLTQLDNQTFVNQLRQDNSEFYSDIIDSVEDNMVKPIERSKQLGGIIK